MVLYQVFFPEVFLKRPVVNFFPEETSCQIFWRASRAEKILRQPSIFGRLSQFYFFVLEILKYFEDIFQNVQHFSESSLKSGNQQTQLSKFDNQLSIKKTLLRNNDKL